MQDCFAIPFLSYSLADQSLSFRIPFCLNVVFALCTGLMCDRPAEIGQKKLLMRQMISCHIKRIANSHPRYSRDWMVSGPFFGPISAAWVRCQYRETDSGNRAKTELNQQWWSYTRRKTRTYVLLLTQDSYFVLPFLLYSPGFKMCF